MGDTTKIPLVSSEISGLWNSYMGDSLSICVLKFFINTVEDSETLSILQSSLDLSNQHIKLLTDFFNQAELTLPDGFADKDINLNAPRLFSDEFYLLYLSNMARGEMLKYTQILSNCARKDIRDYFTKLVNESSDLYNRVADLRLSKGIFTSILMDENIPIPSTPYSSVTDSTIAPFSEKLMMFHVSALGTMSISNDGMAISETLRSDLVTNYMRILTEAMSYAKDGANIMIENKWLEQQPIAIEHRNLVGV